MKKYLISALAAACLLAGCQAPPAEDPASHVFTDWSKLTPYEAPVEKYTRRYADFTDTLIPAGDYGPLVSFPGASLTREDDFYGTTTYYLYGLVTLEGEVVADPVFSAVIRPSFWLLGGTTQYADVYVLTKTAYNEETERMEPVSALAALDGSWCTDFLYSYDWELTYGSDLTQAVPMTRGDSIVYLSTQDGRELMAVDAAPLMEHYGLNWTWDLWSKVRCGERYAPFGGAGDKYFILDTETGAVTPAPEDINYMSAFEDGLARANANGCVGLLDSAGRWVIQPVYRDIGEFRQGYAPAQATDGRWLFLDRAGAVVLELPPEYNYMNLEGDFWLCYDSGGALPARLYRFDLTPIPLPDDAWDVTVLEDGWVLWEREDGGSTLWRDGVRCDIDPKWGRPWTVIANKSVLHQDNQGDRCALLDLTTGAVTPFPDGEIANFQTDPITGEVYLLGREENGDAYLADPEGKIFATGDSGMTAWLSLTGGLVERTYDDRVTLSTPGGELVFAWNIPLAYD